MNISLNWLAEFLPGPAIDATVAADALMRGGLPVEKITTDGEVSADTVLDVEVTSNRSDCLSHAGVARELAALVRREFRDVAIKGDDARDGVPSATPATPQSTSVRIDPGAETLCPYYTARVIRGIRVGPSPKWMLDRLAAIGVRAINNVVDITNYVMFELGQPLHAFDLDKLAGQRIIVREARSGESIASIDGHERKLSAGMLVIADAEQPVAVAGVMGGRATEVSPTTTTVLLESARFDPLCVRRTARQLAMKSDSSYRFERGIDPTLADRAGRRAAQLLCEIAGGTLDAATEAGAAAFAPKQITLRPQRLARLLGIEIPTDEAVDALRRLQLAPRQSAEGISVTVPSWRLDLNIETDLVEEVARVVGYDRIPIRKTISIAVTPPAPDARAMERIRSTLVGAGFFEAVTFTFVSDALAGDFLPPEHVSLPRADSAVRKADARLRPSLLPGLLEAVRRNEANGAAGMRFFEAGSAFGVDAAGQMIETRKLALVGDGDLRALRGAVEAVLARLDATRPVAVIPVAATAPAGNAPPAEASTSTAHPTADARPGYARGAAGRIEWGGKPIGWLGRIDPKVAAKISLREPPVAAELDLPALLDGTQHVPQLRPLPRFPAVRRDVSLIVPDATRYDAINAIIHKQSPADLEEVEYVTTYRGKPLEKGQKSVTFTLIFRSATTTLTSEAVEASVQRVIEAARAQLGATLRT